jgi:hypothetical protein
MVTFVLKLSGDKLLRPRTDIQFPIQFPISDGKFPKSTVDLSKIKNPGTNVDFAVFKIVWYLVVARAVRAVCWEGLPYVLYGAGVGLFYAFWEPKFYVVVIRSL